MKYPSVFQDFMRLVEGQVRFMVEHFEEIERQHGWEAAIEKLLTAEMAGSIILQSARQDGLDLPIDHILINACFAVGSLYLDIQQSPQMRDQCHKLTLMPRKSDRYVAQEKAGQHMKETVGAPDPHPTWCVTCGQEYDTELRSDGKFYCSRCWQVWNS